MTVLRDYIGVAAAQNLQQQLPNNKVQVISNEYNTGSNRLNIRLKVHPSDIQHLIGGGLGN